MSTVKHAVIAVAGFGSRLGMGAPKCMLEFRGRSLLARQIELLAQVEDVRLVVGFRENLVVEHARSLRDDIIFVRNSGYATNTTLNSYEMGARGLDEACLFMDGDIVFEPTSFAGFLQYATQAPTEPTIAFTDANTADAVYCDVRDDRVHSFSRCVPSAYEWANLAYVPPRYFETQAPTVFERLSTDAPLRARHIISHEIDRVDDLEIALRDHPYLSAAEEQAEAARRLTQAAQTGAVASIIRP